MKVLIICQPETALVSLEKNEIFWLYYLLTSHFYRRRVNQVHI